MESRIFLKISELRLSSAKTPPSRIAEDDSRRKCQGKWSGLFFSEMLLLASRILANAPATPTARFATVLNSSSDSREKLRWRGRRNFWRRRRPASDMPRLRSDGSRKLDTQLTRRFILRCWPPVQKNGEGAF